MRACVRVFVRACVRACVCVCVCVKERKRSHVSQEIGTVRRRKKTLRDYVSLTDKMENANVCVNDKTETPDDWMGDETENA